MIPIFYRPEMSCTAAESFSPSAGKPALVMADWMAHPDIAPHIQIEHFTPADADMLYEAHDHNYVENVMNGQQDNGFGNRSSDVAYSLRFTVGSMVAACKHVLTTPQTTDLRVAVSPTSGFHHAGHDFGGGYCTFNGLMAAAIRVHNLGLAKRILILDMDQHYGNGTQNIIRELGIDYVDHITADKSYTTAAQAMQCANLYSSKDMRERKYDLVIYQAGADIHVNDPLGGLLTTSAMRLRDKMVFLGCSVFGVPLVWNLAGGYQRDLAGTIEPVLALHRQTMLECVQSYLGK